MNAYMQKLLSSAFGFLTVLNAASFAHADDTEIFFSGTSNNVVQPNVLFILDTSSSMTNEDGVGITRLDRMKSALTSILNSSNNINVGMMRFSNPGGPVLYPVSDIDAVVGADVAGSIESRVTQGSDDATESNSGTVDLDDQQIIMTTIPGGTVFPATSRVISGADDAEEQGAGGSMYIDSTDLEFMKDGNTSQFIGIRFQNVSVPAGATITSASVEFVIDELKSGSNNDVSIDVQGELSDSGPFLSGDKNISNRTLTNASVVWDIANDSPSVGSTLNTPDITPVIQEIVNDTGWVVGDAITLTFDRASGSGVRTVESFEGNFTAAPILRIGYTISDTTITNTVGLRFQNVKIPQGATVTSAKIEFTSADASTGTATLTFKGEDSDNAATFSATTNDISNRTATTASVDWVVPDWTQSNVVHQSPELATIVQEVVNRTNWCGGNNMAFLITGSAINAGNRKAMSYDQSPSSAPRLVVEYDTDTIPASPGGCLVNDISAQVESSSNDAEENSSGVINLNSSDLELVNDGNDQTIGVRFNNVNVDQGASIVDAYIEFTAKDDTSSATSLTIKGQASDNAPIFTSSANDITGRAQTSASVSWSSIPAWTASNQYRSPALTTIVQEIVNRAGWTGGSSMVFVITGSGLRRAWSFDGSGGEAPRLVIKVQGTGAAASTQRTVRDELITITDNLQYKSGTPIVDTLYEAALYFRGEGVRYGKARGDSSTSRREHTRVSHPSAYTGGAVSRDASCTDNNLSDSSCVTETITGDPIYTSPITDACQSNHIVLLSDGAPSVNTSESLVKTLTSNISCADSGAAACGPELAAFLKNSDQSSSITDTPIQTITTHTIGFEFSSSYLPSIATAGGGNYYNASSAADLVDAFDDIINGIMNVDTSFVSPGVTVNSFNRLNHRDELYFSVFSPDTHPFWPGNLKRYQLRNDGVIIDNSSPQQAAVDDTTGFFKDGAKSFWSAQPDGRVVEDGGAANEQPTTNSTRKVYTYYAGSSNNLTDSANAFTVANKANVSKARLGIDSESDAYHDSLINWARGVDTKDKDNDSNTTESLKALADPLHSKPHLVTYGGTDANPDITIFYGDNQGFLHAIKGSDGTEQFAFIPEELLPNLNTLYTNSESQAHPYGLDGSVTSWVGDVNHDNQIDETNTSANDFVYIYIGMRRGGRNYYGLNVTNRAAPQRLWTITGGSGDFTELGQTWSNPVKTKVKINNTVTDVLIFGGGYDTAQDGKTTRSADSVGRAIFMVNASTGALIWSAGPDNSHDLELSAMQYSIPSDLKIIDVNGDGLVDQMYVGDMGGQVWRFDVENGNNVGTLVTGAVIANLGGATTASNRRFYHAPDVSVQKRNNIRYLAIGIGSGYQAHPLNDNVDDRYYMIFDANIADAPADADNSGGPDYVTLTEANLYNATSNDIGEGDATEQATGNAALAAANGWYIELENNGEKVLASSLTNSGETFFTTYEPTPSTSGCTVSAGTPRLYRVSSSNATPTQNYDSIGEDNALTKNDRSKRLYTAALPAEPQRLRIEGQDIICIGAECETVTSAETIIKTYWYEE